MEQFDALRCNICLENYDLENHIPRIIPKCGHTVCSECLNRILENTKAKCPLDKQLLPSRNNQAFPINFTLRHLLEETAEQEICPIHHKKINLLCLTDKCKVCKHCVEFNGHKDHNLKPITEVKVEADGKRQKLEKTLAILDEFNEEVGRILDEKKQDLLKFIDQKFEKVFFLLQLKKATLAFEVDCMFEQEKNRLHYIVGEDSNVRKNIVNRIALFKDFVKKRDFFNILNYNVSQVNSKLDRTIADKHIADFSANLDQFFELFRGYFKSHLDSLSNFSFPTQNWVENMRIEIPKDTFDDTPLEIFENDNLCPFEIMSSLQIKPNNQGYLEIISKDCAETSVLINIEEWKDIKGVWIQLPQPSLSPKNLRTLAFIVSRMEEIESVWVTAENQKDIDEPGLVPLLSVLFARTKRIQQISISFNLSPVGDNTLLFLAEKIIPRITNINSFELCLGATRITSKGVSALTKNLMPFIKNLNTFRLELGRTFVAEETISEMFVNMPKVRNFMLGASNISISDKSIDIFVKNSLSSMENIEIFSLWLQNTKITDLSALNILGHENIIKNVVTLQISFENTQVSDKGMETLVGPNKMKMKALKNLQIDINGTLATDLTKMNIFKLRESLITESQTRAMVQGIEP